MQINVNKDTSLIYILTKNGIYTHRLYHFTLTNGILSCCYVFKWLSPSHHLWWTSVHNCTFLAHTPEPAVYTSFRPSIFLSVNILHNLHFSHYMQWMSVHTCIFCPHSWTSFLHFWQKPSVTTWHWTLSSKRNFIICIILWR